MNKMFWTCFETESFRPKVSRPDDDRNGGERVQNPYNLSSVSLTENKEGEKGGKGSVVSPVGLQGVFHFLQSAVLLSDFEGLGEAGGEGRRFWFCSTAFGRRGGGGQCWLSAVFALNTGERYMAVITVGKRG